MKGWFLTSGKFQGAVGRLLENIDLKGHTLEIVNCEEISYGIDNDLPALLWKNGERITPPDFFYIADSDGENGVVFPLARQLEAMGSFNYNPIEAKQIAMSKIATYQVLAKEGLPIIKTVVFRKNMDKELLKKQIGLPMIIKPDDGFGGEGVELIQTEEELDTALERVKESDARFLVQKYVSTSKGRDIRVLTIGFEAVFAAQRKASDPNEFRSNLHMGGTAEEYPLTDEMKDICGRAAKAIGLRMAGIDLLFGENGFVIGEVNSSAGFDSWLGKKDLVSIFMKDLQTQLMKRPLARFRYQELKAAAQRMQLSQILMGLDDFAFLKAEQMLVSDCKSTQELVLMEMIAANKDTEFGKKHNFENIKSVEDYRKNVPLSDWEDYADYAKRMENGEENVTFPGKATYFYRTSGTTAAYKYIPESEREAMSRKAISRARNTEIFLMASLKSANRIFAFFNKSSTAKTPAGIACGTASGRSSELANQELIKHLTFVPQIVNEFEGEQLLYVMLRCSLVYSDVTSIIGNNALMVKNLVEFAIKNAEDLIEDIRNGSCKYEMSDELKGMLKEALTPNPARADELLALYKEGHFTPRYYWKYLMAAGFWLGGSVGVYVNDVRPLLPATTRYFDVGYGSSETKINIPTKPETPAAPLATFCSFYEFIPEEGGEPLMAHELEAGKNYEIILTTNAGLYRYRLKDLIHVESFTGTTPDIYFVSKITDVANLAQEKIPGSMLSEAVRDTTNELGFEHVMTQVYPDSTSTNYVICTELKNKPDDIDEFTANLDEGLRKRLQQYDIYRGKLLKECSVKLMKEGWSEYLMKKYAKGNATVAQVKVPVVINEMPDDEWIC